MNYFISIDIGTNFLKAVAFSLPNAYHVETSSSLDICSPITIQSVKQIEASTIPHTVSTVLKQSIQEICFAIPLHIDDTIDICISGNSPTLVFLNEQKEAIYCTSWYSSTPIELKHELSYYLPYVISVREHEKKIFDETRYIMPLAEYASFLLCGKCATFVPYENFIQYLWSIDSINKYNLSSSLFAHVQLSGSILGMASSNFAFSTLKPVFFSLFSTKNEKVLSLFLSRQCRVLCGGIDYLSTLIGSATVEVGDICIRGGTSTVINMCLAQNTSTHTLQSPDYRLFPEFILSHPVHNKINKGISVPLFTVLYQHSNVALTLLQSNSTVHPLFWKLFSIIYKQYGDIDMLNMHMYTSTDRESVKHYINSSFDFLMNFHRKLLQDYFSSYDIYVHKSIIALCYFFSLLKTIYTQITDSVSHCEVKKIAVSGGQCSTKKFAQLLSILFQKNISTYKTEYCELVGNAIFSLSYANRYKNNINSSFDTLVSYAKQFAQLSYTYTYK